MAAELKRSVHTIPDGVPPAIATGLVLLSSSNDNTIGIWSVPHGDDAREFPLLKRLHHKSSQLVPIDHHSFAALSASSISIGDIYSGRVRALIANAPATEWRCVRLLSCGRLMVALATGAVTIYRPPHWDMPNAHYNGANGLRAAIQAGPGRLLLQYIDDIIIWTFDEIAVEAALRAKAIRDGISPHEHHPDDQYAPASTIPQKPSRVASEVKEEVTASSVVLAKLTPTPPSSSSSHSTELGNDSKRSNNSNSSSNSLGWMRSAPVRRHFDTSDDDDDNSHEFSDNDNGHHNDADGDADDDNDGGMEGENGSLGWLGPRATSAQVSHFGQRSRGMNVCRVAIIPAIPVVVGFDRDGYIMLWSLSTGRLLFARRYQSSTDVMTLTAQITITGPLSFCVYPPHSSIRRHFAVTSSSIIPLPNGAPIMPSASIRSISIRKKSAHEYWLYRRRAPAKTTIRVANDDDDMEELPTAECISSLGDERIVAGDSDGRLIRYDVISGRRLCAHLMAHQAELNSVCLLPLNRHLCSVSLSVIMIRLCGFSEHQQWPSPLLSLIDSYCTFKHDREVTLLPWQAFDLYT